MALSVKYPLSTDKLLQSLSELREEKSLCDMELVAEGVKFPVHRVVLAAASPYFKAMFTGGFKENAQNRIELKETPQKGVSAVLDAIYTSEVKITEDNVESILMAASLFQIEQIVKYCETFLCEIISEENFFTFLAVSEKYNLTEAVHTCDEFMLDNFESLAKLSDFCKLSKEKLCDYISNNRLKLPNGEIEVFRAVVRWIESKCNSGTRCGSEAAFVTGAEQNLEVLKLVRFPHIVFDTLLDEVLEHPLVDKSQQLKRLVIEGIRFHGRPLLQPLAEGPQYKTRGEQKVVIIPSGTRNLGYAIKENETKFHSFLLSNGTLTEHKETTFPYSFIFDSVAVVGSDNYLFLFGTDNKSFNPVTLLINSVTGQWTELSAPPIPGTASHAVARVKDKIYLIGGLHVTRDTLFQPEDGQATSAVVEYTILANSWKKLQEMPNALMYHAAATHGSLIYVAGGYRKWGSTLRDMFAYDRLGNIWLTKAGMNEGRCDFCLECVGENLYACGGRLSNHFCNEPSVEMYSICHDQWTELRNVRMEHGAAAASFVCDSKIYLVGGRNVGRSSATTDTIRSLDVTTQTMDRVSTLPFQIADHVCAILTVPRA